MCMCSVCVCVCVYCVPTYVGMYICKMCVYFVYIVVLISEVDRYTRVHVLILLGPPENCPD